MYSSTLYSRKNSECMILGISTDFVFSSFLVLQFCWFYPGSTLLCDVLDNVNMALVTKRKPWLGGNWKSNGTKVQVQKLVDQLNSFKFNIEKLDVVIFPTFIHLHLTSALTSQGYAIGTQSCSATKSGAYTGEISTEAIKDLEIGTTLIGHSERRQYYGETDDVVAKKLKIALENSLCAVVCIGETLQEREESKTTEVLHRQIDAIRDCPLSAQSVVIAYEPVWAIGSGKVATPEQAQEAHQTIRHYLKEKVSAEFAENVRIVYGGSVNAGNADCLIALEDVDGFLVGGASLKPEFGTIIQSVASAS
uniref:Triosephosphate isomerase n=1 Tax=Nephromyces sp. MMRI TaxID=2496275 RepID=A0A3S5HLU8_9APIC|nr:triosephosphate isomerase [Nephromyces sp. MMRI]